MNQSSDSSFENLADQISQMLNSIHSRPFFKFSSSQGWQPSLNLYEIDSHYIICVDLAGMRGEDFDVHTEKRIVIITGKRPPPAPPPDIDIEAHEDALEDCSVHLMEIESGTFRREVEVPGTVDIANITANYRQGFLWITMPKTDTAAPGGDPS